ncbi:MAG: serine/threonine protein kinase [Candidatus Melainabacteria bacterium]|nr:serine/threonine protein kinase [Candidatus Melainabacteria bacterium]
MQISLTNSKVVNITNGIEKLSLPWQSDDSPNKPDDSSLPDDIGVGLQELASLNRRIFQPRLLPSHTVGTIGKGGMSKVFLITRDDDKVQLAQKEVTFDNARPFVNEVSALLLLKHENIIDVVEAGINRICKCSETNLAFRMEYIKDATHIKKVNLENPDEVIDLFKILIKATSALSEVHKNGIVHKDVKSKNIIFSDADNVKLIDFGLSKINRPDIGLVTTIENEGYMVGTPLYMAPEQTDDSTKCTYSSDIYSMVTTLYEALTGEHPIPEISFKETSAYYKSTLEVLSRIRHESPRDIRELNKHIVDKEFASTLLKGLAKEPKERIFKSAEDFSEFLKGVKLEKLLRFKKPLFFLNWFRRQTSNV